MELFCFDIQRDEAVMGSALTGCAITRQREHVGEDFGRLLQVVCVNREDIIFDLAKKNQK